MHVVRIVLVVVSVIVVQTVHQDVAPIALLGAGQGVLVTAQARAVEHAQETVIRHAVMIVLVPVIHHALIRVKMVAKIHVLLTVRIVVLKVAQAALDRAVLTVRLIVMLHAPVNVIKSA